MATALATTEPDKLRDSQYLLKDEDGKDAESKRLTTQYNLLKARIGRSSPVPPEIDLSSVKTILDVAAGNCVWILDVANRPEVKDDSVELYACDINLVKFPPKEETDKLGIKAFVQDVTKPLPEEMREKFDLIHMSAMVAALSESQWKVALHNLRNALSTSFLYLYMLNVLIDVAKFTEPGGYLLLFDYNAGLYPTEQSMPPASWKFGACETLQGNPSHFLHKHGQILRTAYVPAFHIVLE